MKKVFFVLLFSCVALFAQERYFLLSIKEESLINCRDRISDSLNLFLGPHAMKLLGIADSERIAQKCNGELYESVKKYFNNKEISYSVDYIHVRFPPNIENEIEGEIEKYIQQAFFIPPAGYMTVKKQTSQSPVDISFVIDLSKFPMENGIEMWYGCIKVVQIHSGNLYDVEYRIDVFYDSQNLVPELKRDIGVIVGEYERYAKKVMNGQ